MSTPKKRKPNPNKGKRVGKSIQKPIVGAIKKNNNSPSPVEQKSTRSKNISKPNDANGIRLNKYISNSGVCTRRDADLYISSGNVWVNGKVVTEMGYKVQLSDEVKFDGQIIKPIQKSYILINKPKGFTVSASTTNEAKSVYSLTLNASKSLLKPVGKMERNTSGLLLLSNDDSFLGTMNSSGRLRQIYHIQLNKKLTSLDFDKILEGVYIDNNAVKVHDLQYIDDTKRELGLEINSQKNRIVTRIFEKLGYEIEKLDRVVFGGLTKKDLPRGRWRPLTKQELINLKMMA